MATKLENVTSDKYTQQYLISACTFMQPDYKIITLLRLK